MKYSSELLLKIAEQRMRAQYARITVLDWNENPITTIEGRTTNGNISLNSSSALRRSGSLNMIADSSIWDVTSINNLISINKKIKLEIGIKNYSIPTSLSTDDIFWFPLGKYVIASAAVNESAQGITLNVSIKDYMCLLNGDIAGKLATDITYTPMAQLNELGEIEDVQVPIYDLIYSLVHDLGGIAANNIIIDNIDLRIKNTVRWTGNGSVYLVTHTGSNGKVYYVLTAIKPDSGNYREYKTGQNIGYQYVPFVYPSNDSSGLSSSAGESICSVLDKIKNTLGNFEYFFDLDGVFHFQEIRNFLREGSQENELGAAINDAYFQDSYLTKSVFTIGKEFMISYADTPQYANIKNDITIWGETSNKNKIRYRLLIGEKPKASSNESHPVKLITDSQGVDRYIYSASDSLSLTAEDDWRFVQYIRYVASQDPNRDIEMPYGQELAVEFPKIYQVANRGNKTKGWKYQVTPVEGISTLPSVSEMQYYIDIIDTNAIQDPVIRELGAESIGWRIEAKRDTKINCLLAPSFENIALIEAGTTNTATLRMECINKAMPYTQYSKALDISIGSAFNTAYDYLRSILHQMIGYNSSINLSIIPIYHLDVNTRITVPDLNGVQHDYMIKTLSVPLASNGNMSITAQRVVEMI